ncbi:Tectonin beta-propeller repeat-containing protein 1 [Bienertia sinuspersici]
MYSVLLSKMRISNLTRFKFVTNLKPSPCLSCSSHLYFSSHSPKSASHPNTSTLQTSNSDSSSPLDDAPTTDDVTTQELKHRIDRYLGGDMEALPSIFEAILARKLSGKHDETDDEIMEEFRSKTEQAGDQQLQSDEDSDEDLTDSDEELSD